MAENAFPEGTHNPVQQHHEAQRHMAPSEDVRPHKVDKTGTEGKTDSDAPPSPAEGG